MPTTNSIRSSVGAIAAVTPSATAGLRLNAPFKRLRAATQMLALEPRMLFDGALAATADADLTDDGTTRMRAATAAEPVDPAISEPGREILVIDPSVRGWQSLIEGAKAGVEILLLDATRDGVAQIEAAAAHGGAVSAIYVLSHGEQGEVRLGATHLTALNIELFAASLANIGANMTAQGDIQLFGCDVAQGSLGAGLISDLARLTGADVAASTDATGSARLGGDWTLEATTGAIESANPLALAAMDAYADILAPTPVVALPASQDVMLGQTFTFNATFSNTVDTGYAPFINFYVPKTGIDGLDVGAVVNEDDGITINSATYLGAALTLNEAHVVTAAEFAAGTFAHPVARDAGGAIQVALEGARVGDIIYVYSLPFGSVTPGTPSFAVTVNASLSNKADLGSALQIRARSGFRFGADALDNPAADPSVLQAGVSTLTINPTLYSVRTEYVGPEQETATGPNYVRQVKVIVDVADGQTITNADLTSLLPANAQFVSVDTGASTAGTATATPSTTTPGGTLTWRIPSVTGGTGTSDAVLTYNFYVPEFDSTTARVINAASGDDVAVNFNSQFQANWTPIDTRDPVQAPLPAYDPVGNELTITAKSVAIQKSISTTTNLGDSGYSPGDVLRYTLQIQVSDYFALGNDGGNMIITDVLSDGQLFSAGYTPKITINRENGGSVTATDFIGSEFTVDNSQHAAGTGATTITFDLNEIISRLGNAGGAGGALSRDSLVGDMFEVTAAPASADPNLQGGGATTVTITFEASVLDSYRRTPPGVAFNALAQLAINENDSLTNSVTINGTILNSSLAPAGLQTDDDPSGTSVTTRVENVSIEIVRRNDEAVYADGATVLVRPGDEMTYRLRYTLPTGDFENFNMAGYLPLPILRVADPDANAGTAAVATYIKDVTPAVTGVGALPTGIGEWTFRATRGGVDVSGEFTDPTVAVDALQNKINFNFGSKSDLNNAPVIIEAFFRLRTTNDPFADQLQLTALSEKSGTNTPATTSTSQFIDQLSIAQPVLNIVKGVIADNIPGGSIFSQTFSQAGITALAKDAGNTDVNPLLGTFNSGNRGLLNSNLTGVDNGDIVRYAISVQNTGTSSRGAFDVVVRDALPAGFTLAGTPNLRLTYGDGTNIPLASITDTSNNPFATEAAAIAALVGGTGIKFVDANTGDADPFNDQGALGGTRDGAGATIDNGRNIIIISYDAVVPSSLAARTAYSSSALIAGFSGTNNGPAFSVTGLNDAAEVTTPGATVAKTIVSTNQVATTGNDVVIGEKIQYQVVISLAEVTTAGSATQFRDVLDAGLALVSIDSISSSGVVIPGALTIGAPITTAAGLPAGIVVSGDARTIDINFGALANTASTNAVGETITIRYTVVATNVAGNQGATPGPATLLNNAVVWDTAATASAPNVTVVEPALTLSITPTTIVGSLVTYTVVVTNPAGGPVQASEVVIENISLPVELTYVPGSFTNTAGIAPATTNVPGRGATIATLAVGQSSTYTFQATVTTLSAPSLTANATWTSLPGAVGVTDLTQFIAADDAERTGAGGVNDYRVTASNALLATLTGNVWEELNLNAARNGPTERQLAGVTVELRNAAGTIVLQTTTTNSTGGYEFFAVPANYQVRVGTTTTTTSAPGTFRSNYDTDGTSTSSTAVVLPNGGLANVNFGFVGPNTAPTISSLDATTGIYTKGTAAIIVDNSLSVADREMTFLTATNWSGSTIAINRQGGANTNDVFAPSGTLSFTGGNVIVGGTTIGTVTNAAGVLTYTFNATATPALVAQALQGITYANTSATEVGNVRLDYTINDRNGADPTGAQGTLGPLQNVYTIAVPLNNLPLANPNTVDAVQGVGRPFAPGDFRFSDIDPDGTLKAIRIDSLPAIGTLTFNGAPVAIGQLITVAQLGGLTYTAPATVFGQALTTFDYSVCDNNNTLSAAPSRITINVRAIDPPPLAGPIAPVPTIPILDQSLPSVPPGGVPIATPINDGLRELNETRARNDIGAGESSLNMGEAYEPGIPVGRGLGVVPGQFVGQAVRDSQAFRNLLDSRVAAMNDIHRLRGGGEFDETRTASLQAQAAAGRTETAAPLAPIVTAKPAAQAADCIPDPTAQRLRVKPAAPRLALAPKPGAERFTDQVRQADRPAPVKPRAIAKPKPAPRDVPICPPGTVPAPR